MGLRIKVMANQNLFDRYRRLGNSISMLGSVLQNDTEISEGDLVEFHLLSSKFIRELEKLESTVGIYINGCNGIEDD